MHLLNNAIDALQTQPFPRRITIRTEAVSGQEPVVSSQEGQPTTDNRQLNADWVVIRIADNGCGMSEEVRHKIFDPFFTTKPVGYGTGLGLSISYQIVVDKHGGQLLCNCTPGQGTEFAIVLPSACLSIL
jgi:signal transduction histidine kinase